MKKLADLLKAFMIVFAILLNQAEYSFSSSETYTNQVTVRVPSHLFINADQKDLNLSFSDYKKGSESNTQSIVYTVSGNNMTQSDGATAVSARLDGVFTDIDLKVQVGTYTKEGGNTELRGVSSDFVVIGDSETAVVQKANTTDDGKLLRGQIAMTYKAVATDNLSSGDHSRQLTITFTDI